MIWWALVILATLNLFSITHALKDSCNLLCRVFPNDTFAMRVKYQEQEMKRWTLCRGPAVRSDGGEATPSRCFGCGCCGCSGSSWSRARGCCPSEAQLLDHPLQQSPQQADLLSFAVTRRRLPRPVVLRAHGTTGRSQVSDYLLFLFGLCQ